MSALRVARVCLMRVFYTNDTTTWCALVIDISPAGRLLAYASSKIISLLISIHAILNNTLKESKMNLMIPY